MTDKIEPCPFCNDAMEISNGDVLRHIHQSDCIIGKQAWGATQKYLDEWNKRTTEQQAAAHATIAELREALINMTIAACELNIVLDRESKFRPEREKVLECSQVAESVINRTELVWEAGLDLPPNSFGDDQYD